MPVGEQDSLAADTINNTELAIYSVPAKSKKVKFTSLSIVNTDLVNQRVINVYAITTSGKHIQLCPLNAILLPGYQAEVFDFPRTLLSGGALWINCDGPISYDLNGELS
jgi:hypothetical protein